ncbi:MAG: preprotein translocase subunit YajC [Syntrophomonadaceae bacterium]|jgi:preprotein translocase subunit YajC|nr:preprotein translocase subunit YajC [Syntrophomonadaceae bacterium]
MFFGQTASQTWTSSLMFLVAFFAIFYFLIILPRKKQEKKHNEMVQNLRVHDRIVTIGGIHGEVKKLKEKTLILKVSDGAEIEILKSAVAYLQEED